MLLQKLDNGLESLLDTDSRNYIIGGTGDETIKNGLMNIQETREIIYILQTNAFDD